MYVIPDIIPHENDSSTEIETTLALIASLGRQDAYAEYVPPVTNGDDRTRGRYKSVKKPLTDKVLARHINGGPAVGIYPMAAGDTTVRTATFDLDNHDGTVSSERMTEVAKGLRSIALIDHNMPLLPARSGGG